MNEIANGMTPLDALHRPVAARRRGLDIKGFGHIKERKYKAAQDPRRSAPQRPAATPRHALKAAE